MPLVRSSGNIPADVEQEAANTTLVIDDGAGGDSGLPIASVERPRTRLQSRREAKGQDNTTDRQVRRIVEESLRSFREEMTNLVAESLRTFTMANIGQERRNDRDRTDFVSREDNIRDDRSSISHNERIHVDRNSRNGDTGFDRNSEKILNLIRNWKVRFTGDTSDMRVNEFIYRVNTLTNANLKGDFDLLCEHAHILFEGRALKWFWRYHRSCGNMNWDDLCEELKRQYKDYDTDFDIKDDILRRKQKHNETFDDYYDAIMVICDRLRNPLPEYELCEIIQRNLRPEVRHELLHLDINRLDQLRRAVTRHEKFVKDMSSSNLNRKPYQKTHV